MMETSTALYNGKLVEALSLNIADRGLSFGDGLFETILLKNQTSHLLPLHIKRLHAGAEALRLNAQNMTTQWLSKAIGQLSTPSEKNTDQRVKLLVWRNHQNQKAYFSKQQNIEWLLTITPTLPFEIHIKEKALFAHSIVLHYTSISQFKTISALPYVMAANERAARGVDELILTDVDGHIAEAVSANIFWITDNKIYTPSLLSGCVNGVMRQHIMALLQKVNIPVKEVLLPKSQLQHQGLVFTCNVAGISVLKSIENQELAISNTLLELIKQQLAL